jgi:8-hydroxy-5-deazaflavin:NADPH oxidoreductase
MLIIGAQLRPGCIRCERTRLLARVQPTRLPPLQLSCATKGRRGGRPRLGRVGSTVGRPWHAAGHDVTFAARSAARPRALAAELGERAHAASVADAVAGAEVVLVAVPGPAVIDALQAAGPLDGRVMIDAANSFGQAQVRLRSLADAFPQARWVRALNSLSASIMADDNHRKPPWVMFLSGDEEAKPAAAQLVRDAGFDPLDLGGIDDSRLQDADSPLWINILTHDEATALVARIKSGDTAAADQSALRTRARELAAPFEKLRDHAPEDPAFFFEHLSRSVFEAGISWRVVNAREVLAILGEYGSIRGYLASFPDAAAAAADMRRRLKFLGDTGVRRLLTSAAGDNSR